MNISIRKTSLGDDVCRGILNRAKEDLSSARDAVWPILEDVRKNGDSAVRKYTEKFDGIVLSSFAVKPSEVKTEISSAEKKAFEKAKENIWNFHELQKPVNREKTVDGNRLGIRYTPIERLAVYAPGGTALYPSSVLMGVIPAKIAPQNLFLSFRIFSLKYNFFLSFEKILQAGKIGIFFIYLIIYPFKICIQNEIISCIFSAENEPNSMIPMQIFRSDIN